MNVLKDILDNVSDAIIVADPSGRVVLFNKEAARIQRCVSDAPLLMGTHLTDLASAERKDSLAHVLRKLKRSKKPVKNFAEYCTQQGGRLFLEISYVPVLGPERTLKAINIIAQDVTNRKLFESKLRASEAQARRLLEDAHAVVVSIDSRGYVVEWNSYCAQLTGFDKGEVLSKEFLAFLTSDSRPVFRDLMATALKNESATPSELALRAKDGAEKTVILGATPRTNANGYVIGATLVGHDITELTMYRRSVETLVQTRTAALQTMLKKEKEALEMKSRFVSIASHEFRTPLSSIDFAANFIKRNAATIGSKKLNEKVEVIEKHVSHMTHLLEDVLNFSKNEAGKIQVLASPIQLDRFVQSVVEEVICNARHSHHVCVSTNSLGTICTDEKLMRNILINLLTNAIKYSPGKEEVFLNVLDEDCSVSFEVRDEGIGIPEEEIGLIFQPFVRGKAVDGIAGTGLGLSIVKRSVELLNGTIEVKSRPGRGSVFKVTIPHHGLS